MQRGFNPRWWFTSKLFQPEGNGVALFGKRTHLCKNTFVLSLSKLNQWDSIWAIRSNQRRWLLQLEANENEMQWKSCIMIGSSLSAIDQCDSEGEGCFYASEGEVWTWHCFELKKLYCCWYGSYYFSQWLIQNCIGSWTKTFRFVF